MQIFSLFGKIFVDNEEANKGIDKTTQKAKETSKSFGQTLGDIGGGITKAGTMISAGVGAVTGAVTYMANKTGEYAGSILDASRKTSISTDLLQQLKYAGEQSGVSFEDLTGSANKFNKVLSDLQVNGSTGVTAFDKLGIAIKDSGGNARASSDVYNDVIMKLASMGDSAEANALGNEVFGKSFANLKPLLAEGAGGIEAFKQQASELGLVMDEGAIKAGDDFSDSLGTLQASLGGLLNQLLGSIMPVIQPIIDAMIANMPAIQAGLSQFAPIIAQLFTELLPPLMDLAKQILPILLDLTNQLLPFIIQIIQGLLPIFSQILQILLPPLVRIIQTILPDLLSIINFIIDSIKVLFDNFNNIVEVVNVLSPLIAGITGAFVAYELITKATAVAQGIMTGAMTAWNIVCGIATGVTGAFGAVLAFVTSPIGIIVIAIGGLIAVIVLLVKNWDTVKKVTLDVFSVIGNFIGGVIEDIKNAVSGITKVFQNVFGGIIGIVKAPINGMIDLINGFISGLNKIKIPNWVPGVGGKGISLPKIPRLKVGMDFVPYDEFPALLHKGERVLTAEENKAYNKPNSIMNTINNVFNIDKIEVRKDSDIKLIAEELYYLQKREVLA